jgi:hypothetical protein
MNTVARLMSDGILYANLFDELSDPSRNVSVDSAGIFYSNTLKEGEFSELTSGTPMRIINNKDLRVLNYFDELTGVGDVTPSPTPTPLSATVVLDLDASLYSGSGNWLDNSGNGNDGIASGTPTYVSGSGDYFDFDGGATTGPGTRDSFGVTDDSTLDTMSSISFEMWINIDTVQGTGAPNLLFGKRSTSSNGYVAFFTNTGYIFRAGTSSPSQLSYSTTPTTGSWQHIIVTIGGSGSKMYINDTEVVSSGYTGNFSNINTSTTLRIADISIAAVGVNALDGKIGLFRIYDGILTSTDVTTRWNATKSRFGL